MTVFYLYIAGCNESEGNDWAEMADWAYDYLEEGVLPPGETATVELVDGCYNILPVYEDETAILEKIEVEGDTTVPLVFGG